MLGTGLGLGVTRLSGGPRNRAPTDIAWAGAHSVAEDAALGTAVGGALSFVDPDVGEAGTFTLAVDAGGRFAIGADGASVIVAGVLDYETATSHDITVRFTDVGGLTFDEAFTVTVTDVSEDVPENPPPPDPPPVVDDPDRYDVLPYTVEVSGSVKFAGKKKNDGLSAKMLMDFNGASPPLALAAGKIYTIHITLDASLMSAQGALATVGIAFKAGNDFWLTGAKGPTTANAVQVYGDNLWNQQAGFTEVDGGDILHGSQLDLWLQIQTSADGTTATIRTSSDGNDFDDEFTDADLVVFDDVGAVTQWGPAAIFHSADGGPFAFNVEYWAAETTAFVEYVTSASADINATSTTLNNVSIGAVVDDRVIIVAIASESGTPGHRVTGVTIGGVAATRARLQSSTGEGESASVWHAPVPTGTTANIAITFSDTADSVAVGVYRSVGYFPSHASGSFISNGTSASCFIDIQSGDVIVGVVAGRSHSVSRSFSAGVGAEDANTSVAALGYAFAHHIATGTENGRTITTTLGSAEYALSAVTVWTQRDPSEGEGAWTPAALDSLRGWYDPDALAGADGSNVSSLTDQSAWGNHATQATGADQPSLEHNELNGLKVLHVDKAGTEYMSLPDMMSNWGEGTLVAVLKCAADPGAADNGSPFKFGTTVSSCHFPLNDGNIYTGDLQAARPTLGNPSFSLASSYFMYGVESGPGSEIDGSVSTGYRVKLNGSSFYTETGLTASTPSKFVAPSAPVIGRSSASVWWGGDIALVLLFRKRLTAVELALVEGYAMHRYGLQALLPSNHTYRYAAPSFDLTILSNATSSVAENAALAHSLAANQTVTWSIVGGADQARFEISGSTLRFAGNGTKDFEAPDDADANNTYLVAVRATNGVGQTTDQTITVTVTNVGE